MLIIYRTLINIIFLISPFILFYRLLKKKEHPIRFKEKLGLFTKTRKKGLLIWFHGASVGELKSIMPIVLKLHKNRKIKQILITSSTLSSSGIINNLKLKKVTHQFFPIDTNFISKKFLAYWKPSKAIFIDSEIWPNTMLNLEKSKINTYLVNGRITEKTFKKWMMINFFSKKIFGIFKLCLASDKTSYDFLKKLGAKNIRFIGNLKFSKDKNDKNINSSAINKFFKGKKIWCASSTHRTEEFTCGKVHLKLKKKFKNICTIIIPRHIERNKSIKNELESLNLKVHLEASNKNIEKNTDIYLVNSFGKTKLYFNKSKIVFLGGSLISHGGQNPIEAARSGCSILTGPNISNFSEIFLFLKKNNICDIIYNENDLAKKIMQKLSKNNNTKNLIKKIDIIGKKIFNKTYNEIFL